LDNQRLDLKTCKYIKTITIFESNDGRIRQNSHLLASIQLMEWASSSKPSLWTQSTIVTHKALCTDKKSIRLNGLFYVWWCVTCIILCLQQQAWLLKP